MKNRLTPFTSFLRLRDPFVSTREISILSISDRDYCSTRPLYGAKFLLRATRARNSCSRLAVNGPLYFAFDLYTENSVKLQRI